MLAPHRRAPFILCQIGCLSGALVLAFCTWAVCCGAGTCWGGGTLGAQAPSNATVAVIAINFFIIVLSPLALARA